MKTRNIQSIELTLQDPFFSVDSLALGTVRVFAGVIMDHHMAALLTDIGIEATLWSVALKDIADSLILLGGKSREINLIGGNKRLKNRLYCTHLDSSIRSEREKDSFTSLSILWI